MLEIESVHRVNYEVIVTNENRIYRRYIGGNWFESTPDGKTKLVKHQIELEEAYLRYRDEK